MHGLHRCLREQLPSSCGQTSFSGSTLELYSQIANGSRGRDQIECFENIDPGNVALLCNVKSESRPGNELPQGFSLCHALSAAVQAF